MFATKKSILFITKSKARISIVTLASKPKENVIAESDWNFDNLSSFILQFRKSIGNSARLLLSEDFVYVITLSFPQEVTLNRDIIRQKAQEFIPEDLNDTIWDFREVSNRKILVAASVKNLYEHLSEAIIKSGLHIETIEPLSFALARLTKNEEYILFIYLYDKAYLTLAQKEAVFATERLDLPLTLGKVKKFIVFTKENFGIAPKEIVFCGNIENLNLKEYEKENFKVQIQPLSPAISLAYKDIKNRNNKELNLELMKSFSPSSPPNKMPIKKNKSSALWIIAIFLILIVIVIEILIYFMFNFHLKLN